MLYVLRMLLVNNVLSDPTFRFAWLFVRLRNSLQSIVGKLEFRFANGVSLARESTPILCGLCNSACPPFSLTRHEAIWAGHAVATQEVFHD